MVCGLVVVVDLPIWSFVSHPFGLLALVPKAPAFAPVTCPASTGFAILPAFAAQLLLDVAELTER